MGNLVPCIRNALLRGYIAPPVLAPRIVSARQQWLDWHHDFAANQLPAMVAEDLELARKADAMDNRAGGGGPQPCRHSSPGRGASRCRISTLPCNWL